MNKRIFILRHGQTVFNSQRKLQGHCDSPLTPHGITQVEDVSATLKNYLSPDQFYVYASPLGRTIQTAQIVCDALEIPYSAIIKEPRIKEYFLGDWEQQSIHSLTERYPEFLQQRDWLVKTPNGETLADVQQRLTSWLDELPTDKDIVVVSHGLTGLTLRAMLANLSYDEMWRQEIPQDAFFMVQNGALTRVDCFSDDALN